VESIHVRVRVSFCHPQFGNVVVQENGNIFERNTIAAQSRRERMPA